MSRTRGAVLALLSVATAVVVVAAVVFAYRDSPPTTSASDVGASTDAADPIATTQPPTTTTTRGRRGSGEPVVFAFGGDVHFEGLLRSQLTADPAGVLDPIAPTLEQADLAIVNLETAVTERGSPAAKQYTFRAPASVFTALSSAGIDLATMANNHGLDFGTQGLEDSLAARDAAGFPVVGIGRNAAEAYAPYLVTIKGQRIAVIGATQVLDDNLVDAWTATATQPGLASARDVGTLVAEVARVRPDVDTLVVVLHWGTELATCPTERQMVLAAQLVAAGADIVVGGHSHRIEGAGKLGDALVAYGLGNFVWYAQGGPSADSGVLFVTATGREIDSYGWVPARISNGVARPLQGAAADAQRAAWDALRACTDLTP